MYSYPKEESKRYLELYRVAHNARDKYYQEKKNSEEFYYGDVEGTFTEFTVKQLSFINKMFEIPISVKICYPIVEQILSFLTGSKPFPKLIASAKSTEEFTTTYQEAYQGVWYESHANDELRNAIKDTLVTGSGYMRVRKNNYFNETTFNVIQEYVPWRQILVDPLSEKADLSDARFIIIAKQMLQAKAEKEYDIVIKNSMNDRMSYPYEESEFDDYIVSEGNVKSKEHKFVMLREIFEQEEINVYIGEGGQVSSKRPKSIDMPNPIKLALGKQLEELQAEASQIQQQSQQAQQTESEVENSTAFGLTDPEGFAQSNQQTQETVEMGGQRTAEIEQQLQDLEIAYIQEPEMVPGFRMITERGEEIEVLKVSKIKKKRIKRVLMVGDTIVERGYEITDKYPIVHFTIQHLRSPNRTYGIIHYIKDLVKAMNKMWASMIYDMMVTNSPKVLYAEGTIEKLSDVETSWSLPHAWTKYIPDYNLPNGGKPDIVPPMPLNQATVQVLQSFQQLIEYITGIYGVIQGNGAEAPGTFSATQSLQSFGTQRVKLYSRSIERSLENLAYSTVSYIQAYTPKDKYMQYLDDNGDMKEVTILDNAEDLEFKVRVEMTSSLPTFRQAQTVALGNIAQTAGDPNLQSLLTQFMLETSDLPKGKEWAEQLDIIKQMSSQLQQLQQELEGKDAQMKSMENNLAQKEIANNVDKKSMEGEMAIEKDVLNAQTDIKLNAKENNDVPDF
jgi:hypothetical protein